MVTEDAVKIPPGVKIHKRTWVPRSSKTKQFSKTKQS